MGKVSNSTSYFVPCVSFDSAPASPTPSASGQAATDLGADAFESTPIDSSYAYSPSAAAYCNWPGRDVIADDSPLPREVLTQAAQRRFDGFNPSTFGNGISFDRLPPAVQELFAPMGGPSASYFRIRVAGTPVYAASHSDRHNTYILLADRNGTALSTGYCPRAADGSLKPAHWRSAE